MQGGEWWKLRGRCRAGDPDALFVMGAAQHEAKKVCNGCPVKITCLVEALEGGIEHGVWGGKTERERREMRRKYVGNDWRKIYAVGLEWEGQLSDVRAG